MRRDNKTVNVAARVSQAQKDKLDAMATELGLSVNAVIGLLIDNAAIEPVTRQEPVARLDEKQKSDCENLAG